MAQRFASISLEVDVIPRAGLAAAALVIVLAPSLGEAIDVKKRYERQLIRAALDRKALAIDPNPEGKIIDRIYIDREDVVARSDPWPNFLNIFHVKTRDYIVRQEMLLHPGMRYVGARAYETERNLRRLFILAVARVVAVRSARPGHVSMLVVTKDLWSIRLNMLYAQNGSLVTLLDFTPTEENFLGRNKRVSLHLRLSQLETRATFPFPLTLFTIGRRLRDHVAIGQRYRDNRVLSTRLRLLEELDLFINGDVPCAGSTGTIVQADPQSWCPEQESGDIYGAAARLRLERPLFALATRWSFHIDGVLNLRQIRLFSLNTSTKQVRPGERLGVSIATRIFAPEGGEQRNVPYVYDHRDLSVSAGITRRFGFSTPLRHDLGFGLLTYDLRSTPPGNFSFDKVTRDWFVESVVPRSELASTLFISYNVSPIAFERLRNINSFALSEDFPIGPVASAEIRFGQNLRFADQAFAQASASASYRWLHRIHGGWLDGENILTAAASAALRYQRGLEGMTPWVNKTFSASIYEITPQLLWIGRLHLYGMVSLRKDDLFRGYERFSDSIVRGYSSTSILGRNAMKVSIEYRTLPINIWTFHLGAVLFYDGGTVWGRLAPGQEPQPFTYRHTVGIGLRGLIPQFDRMPLRADFGFPIEPNGRGAVGTWFSFSFGQAFPPAG